MKQYYRLNLNCARVREKSPFTNDYGFIKVLPVEGIEIRQGFFGSKVVPTIEYIGEYYVIAVLQGNYFKEVICSKNIEYDKEGLCDISVATTEELEQNLSYGLTCNSFIEIEEEVAFFYINKIIDDPNALAKYTSELNEIERKENVLKELESRRQHKIISPNIKPKVLKRTQKSG